MLQNVQFPTAKLSCGSWKKELELGFEIGFLGWVGILRSCPYLPVGQGQWVPHNGRDSRNLCQVSTVPGAVFGEDNTCAMGFLERHIGFVYSWGGATRRLHQVKLCLGQPNAWCMMSAPLISPRGASSAWVLHPSAV